jgi:hypothetical protein
MSTEERLVRGFTESDSNSFRFGRAALWRNFDVNSVRAACEACSAIWNLSSNSALL